MDAIYRIYKSESYQQVWQSAIENTSDGVIIFERQMLSANRQFKQMMGLNGDDGQCLDQENGIYVLMRIQFEEMLMIKKQINENSEK